MKACGRPALPFTSHGSGWRYDLSRWLGLCRRRDGWRVRPLRGWNLSDRIRSATAAWSMEYPLVSSFLISASLIYDSESPLCSLRGRDMEAVRMAPGPRLELFLMPTLRLLMGRAGVLLQRWGIGQVRRRYEAWLRVRWMCTPAAPRGGKLLAKKPWGLTMAAGGMVVEVQSEVRGMEVSTGRPPREEQLLPGGAEGSRRQGEESAE